MSLVAGRCAQCGNVAYPAEPICNACGYQGQPEPVELSPEGRLYTFTVVHAAAPGVDTPYALGYVDVAEGARLFGRIVLAGRLAVDMPLRIVSESAGSADRYWFEPLDEEMA